MLRAGITEVESDILEWTSDSMDDTNLPETFREALIQHMDAAGVGAAEVARRTGVSKPVIDKLRQRKAITTNVGDAVRLARYFGKSVEALMGADVHKERVDEMVSLFYRLSPEQSRIIRAQIHAVANLPPESDGGN